jgi:hypothetical protein
VAAIDDPQGVKPRVIFVTCPLVPLTRRCFRLARGPLGGTAETPRTSCNSRVDGKISVIFPPFVHLSLRVRRSRPVRSEKRIYGWKMYAEAGGLMSYGPILDDVSVRVAVYVDKILKGAKPADLPVEQPTKLEMVVNRQTATALGLEIPPGLICAPTR